MQRSTTLISFVCIILISAVPILCVKERAGGSRPSTWRNEVLRGRIAKEFDPTISSLDYCESKTYPQDGKRLPAVRTHVDVRITSIEGGQVLKVATCTHRLHSTRPSPTSNGRTCHHTSTRYIVPGFWHTPWSIGSCTPSSQPLHRSCLRCWRVVPGLAVGVCGAPRSMVTLRHGKTSLRRCRVCDVVP